MPELRWILVGFGLVLLVGIYVWGRRASKKKDETAIEFARPRPEPRFESEPAYEASDVGSLPPEAAIDEAESVGIEPEASPVGAVDEPVEPTLDAPVQRSERAARRPRIEPTFNEESIPAELPAPDRTEAFETPEGPPPQRSEAPTISMSSTPPPRRIERRKIIALRLSTMPQRIPGAQLKAALEAEALQHGKYDVFHRLDEQGNTVFSVASMVEPGTFDPEKMPQETYPGVTLFTQLPGPIAGMLAFNELVACGRRLHAELGGTLQDERGVPLTVHRIERIRQEIREFELRPAGETATHR
jgi:cell division protein ZipA